MKYSKLPRPPKSALQLARNLRNSMTASEWRLWGHIRRKQLGVRFKRQVPIGNYIVDFFALEIGLVVEGAVPKTINMSLRSAGWRRSNLLPSGDCFVVRSSLRAMTKI